MLTMAAPMAAASVRPCDVGNHNDYGGGDYGGGDYGGGYGGYYGDDDGGYDDDGDYGSSSEVTPVNLIFAGVVILLIVVRYPGRTGERATPLSAPSPSPAKRRRRAITTRRFCGRSMGWIPPSVGMLS